MGYYRYWGILIIILFVAAVSFYLFIPRFRQDDVLKSNISSAPDEIVSGDDVSTNQNEMLSFPNQFELLASSWKRDPFSLQSLKKDWEENVKNRDHDLKPPTVAMTDSIPATAPPPEHISTASSPSKDIQASGTIDKHITTTPSINEKLAKLKLTGIVFFDNQYMALINDSGLKEGETILGFKVAKIRRDTVVLKDGLGNYHTLEL